MEPLVEELLRAHDHERDLSPRLVQREVEELRSKYGRIDETLEPDEQLVGLDWRDASLEDFNFKGLKLSYNLENKKANFCGAHLERAKLINVIAKGAIFEKSFLTGADLSDSHFEQSNFISSQLDSVNLENTKLYNAKIENANFKQTDIGKSIDLEFTIYNKLNEDDINSPQLIYLNFENYLKSKGFMDKASKCYYRRRTIETNGYKKSWKKSKKNLTAFRAWSVHRVWDFLCGYGVDPLKVLRAWVITIFFSAVLYFIFWDGIEFVIGINLSEIWEKGVNSFYFSGVTFTTLGFGDLCPDPNIPLMKLVAMVEAFLGAFLMALFVVTLSRKMIR